MSDPLGILPSPPSRTVRMWLKADHHNIRELLEASLSRGEQMPEGIERQWLTDKDAVKFRVSDGLDFKTGVSIARDFLMRLLTRALQNSN